jgi:tetratricopeptide (TPR) repeat protein
MGRFVLHPVCLFAVLALGASAGRGADQNAAVRDAAEALQRGDSQSAEKILRTEIQTSPGDAWALSLLGVTLDNLKRSQEAEEFHRRAVELSPRSAEIQNNYGTHLWNAGQYEKAESSFASALAAAPAYFNVLYNLGVMATYTGHYERAREVLEAALRQQPKNVDVLYRLACADEASKQWEAAVMLLAQAAKLDSGRADVQKLLALTTTELGALDDAAAAWDRYLKLDPNDDAARRERGYTAAKTGKLEYGIAELEWFVARHPDDLAGQYELGQAERTVDMAQALLHLDKAVALDQNYVPARSARGSLYYQEGKPEFAVKDLELAASLEPDNAASLDSLGQTYQALNRTADALKVLRRAAGLAPEDSKTLLHLGRALADAGLTEESGVVMERFRQLGPGQKKGVPAGLVEYLSLTPEQRHAEYRARVEKAVRDRPDDPAAQVSYLKLMIENGNSGEAATAAKRIAELKPGSAVLADAGRALLKSNHYELSRNLLEQAAAAGPLGVEATLDLAMATFHASGKTGDSKTGLKLMDGIPESARSGDYYLARAEMLDASGQPEEAVSALGQAMRASPKRPDLYLQAAAYLVRKGRAPDALRLIGEAARALPEDREILLMKATTMEFAGQTGDAEQLMNEIQKRWPEWSNVWVAHGMVLDAHRHYEQARQALETAVALDAHNPAAYYFLADCTLRSGAERKDAAENAIGQALKLSPADPWILALAGRIAFARGAYELAVERQRAAIAQRPRFIEAHRNLAEAYAALGRKQEAQAELEKTQAMERESNAGDASGEAPYLRSLFQGSLFSESARGDARRN